MKIKTDFVTNSSSVNFIISSPVKVEENDLLTIIQRHSLEHYDVFTDIESLITHTQQDECDWVTKIRGPYRYWNMSTNHYTMCKRIIADGNMAIYMTINNNFYEEMDMLEKLFKDKGGSILLRESD